MFRQSMARADGKSRHTRFLIGCAVLTGAVALSAPGSASGAPAVDEYTLRVPDARGDANLGQTAPRSQPGELPTSVRRELGGSADEEALATIATADELRAPPRVKGDANAAVAAVDADGRGLLGAMLSGVADPLGLAAILGLAGITAAIFLTRRSRPDDMSGDS